MDSSTIRYIHPQTDQVCSHLPQNTRKHLQQSWLPGVSFISFFLNSSFEETSHANTLTNQVFLHLHQNTKNHFRRSWLPRAPLAPFFLNSSFQKKSFTSVWNTYTHSFLSRQVFLYLRRSARNHARQSRIQRTSFTRFVSSSSCKSNVPRHTRVMKYRRKFAN